MSAVNWKKILEAVANPDARLLNGVQFVMVLAVAYGMAQLTWRLMPAPEIGPTPVPVFESVTRSVSRGVGFEKQISQWHLFGNVEVKVAAPESADLPETNLKLTLRGVIASSEPSEARAIVADPSGKENFYKIDDKLPGNAVLKEVHGDRIVIQRGVRYETLKLPKELLGLSATSPAPRRAAQQSTPVRGGPLKSLGQVRDVLLNDPQRLADVLRIMPKRNKGRFVGYELQPGRDTQFLSRHGLMPGDVVTSINGVQLDSPVKGLSLMKDVSTMEMLDIEVERNGTLQRFSLPVK